MACGVVESDGRRRAKNLLCCFPQSEEKEVDRVIEVFKYKLKKPLVPVFGKWGNPEQRLKV